MGEVIKIQELQYKKFAQSNINLALDAVYITKKAPEQIAKEMIKGYMSMLSK